jgi:dolichol-phosphate mannosyltransferase
MSKLTELSVFFPAYNEESNIEKTVTQAAEILPSIAKTWEIIIVNDGSRDKTEAVSQSLARKDHRIRVITHSPNRGYGAALKSGFTNAKYEWIAFTDDN